jgi:UDP-2-acetamido-3-amino-2,3-dideoxy-glucuronate N-acetyltransferase
MHGAEIGENCSFGQNVFIGNVKIGSNVKVQNNVSIYDGVEIQDDVFCGPSCVFTNVINPRSQINRQGDYLRTIIKKGVSIGANATIVCGVTLGEFSFIGAGAVITKDTKPFSLNTGVPARCSGWMSKFGSRMIFKNNKYSCDQTNDLYTYNPSTDTVTVEEIN